MCATTGSGPLQRGTGALIAPLVSLTGRRVPAPAISHRIQYSTRGGPARACERARPAANASTRASRAAHCEGPSREDARGGERWGDTHVSTYISRGQQQGAAQRASEEGHRGWRAGPPVPILHWASALRRALWADRNLRTDDVVDGDEDELDEEAHEAHHHKAQRRAARHLGVLCRARARGERVSEAGTGGEWACENDGRHSSREGFARVPPRARAGRHIARVAARPRRHAAAPPIGGGAWRAGAAVLRAASHHHQRARRAGRCRRHSCVPARGGGGRDPALRVHSADRAARGALAAARANSPSTPCALARMI